MAMTCKRKKVGCFVSLATSTSSVIKELVTVSSDEQDARY